MIEKKGDPVGTAILDYIKTRKPDDIIVSSDICEDDVIPVEVLFRNQNEMPDLELMALESCKGKVLDVGAGAGAHSKELIDRGLDVDSIEISDGAVQYMKSIGLNARKINFFDLKNEKYDTILMMMNGIGIAGKLSNLENTLLHAKNLLQPGGKILCDSSDIKYLYEDEDGALWVDLNSEYFKKEKGPWFDWLYVDFENLFNAAKNVGLKAKKKLDQDDHYLAEITLA
jgi:2-polyprenyl-3-methyl-5-hydroxy-6-metoxy-1,4-benzoquinol methylase